MVKEEKTSEKEDDEETVPDEEEHVLTEQAVIDFNILFQEYNEFILQTRYPSKPFKPILVIFADIFNTSTIQLLLFLH
ncbi:hypothetical protein [Alteribacter populi]|uniref:hypothetical protein n=1 Tax=Alteribacter populi TaxID=2011011 RepID=UPI000BBAE430|nr:hypothetical protein [Alteribacter populi]